MNRRAPGKGELVVVGTGIQYGRHTCPRALSEVERADRVFCLADSLATSMLGRIRPDLVSLAGHYETGKDRRRTYREMEADILAEVEAGKRVCAVFYGHPGVFADVPHAIIRRARQQGHPARMEPGISAEACLYADLGMDPGSHGVQSFEATQFLIQDRRVDPCSLLILWQVALAGDLDCARFEPDPRHLEILVDKLQRWYRAATEVILYEASRLPIEPFRAERMRLDALPGARYREFTTLVIPPVVKPSPDEETRRALRPG